MEIFVTKKTKKQWFYLETPVVRETAKAIGYALSPNWGTSSKSDETLLGVPGLDLRDEPSEYVAVNEYWSHRSGYQAKFFKKEEGLVYFRQYTNWELVLFFRFPILERIGELTVLDPARGETQRSTSKETSSEWKSTPFAPGFDF